MIDEKKRLPASPDNEGPGPSLRLWMWFLIAMLFAFYWTALTQQAQPPPIAYSEFKALVRAGDALAASLLERGSLSADEVAALLGVDTAASG